MNTPPPAVPPPPAPPRMKRWKKVLLIVGCVFVGLILVVLLVGPTIIASVARSKITAVIGEMLEADATVGDVSFSWSGRIGIRDLRIVPRGFAAPLLELPQVDLTVSLLSAAGGRYIAEVELVGPRIIVEKRADGRFSGQVMKPSPAPSGAPSSPSAPSAPTHVEAKIRVRDGEITLRAHGLETVYRSVTLEANVDTLAKPVGYSFSLSGPAQDRITVKGEYAVAAGSGPVVVELEKLSLKNLAAAARAFSPVSGLDGTVTGRLDYELKGLPVAAGKARLAVAGLLLQMEGRDVRLAGAGISHEGSMGARGAAGGDLRIDLKGLSIREGKETISLDALGLSVAGAIDEEGNGSLTLTPALGAVLTGTVRIDAADAFRARRLKTEIALETDLKALADLLRSSGLLKADLSLDGTATLKGAVQSVARGRIQAPSSWDLESRGTGIRGVLGGKPFEVGDVVHTNRGAIDRNGTGRGTLVLSSGKAAKVEIVTDVTGAFDEAGVVSTLTAESDLAELGRRLEKLLGLKADTELAGRATITGRIEAQGAVRARGVLDAAVSDLVAVDRKAKKTHELDREIRMKLAADWDAADPKRRRATLETLSVTSSFATVAGKGGVTLGERPGSFEIGESSLTLNADLQKLAGKLASFLEKPAALGGSAAVKARAAGEKISVDGTFAGLRYDRYGPFDATLAHAGTVDSKGNGLHTLRVEAGRMLSFGAQAEVKGAVVSIGSFKGESDLGALAKALPGVLETKPGTTLAGRATVSGRAEVRGAEAASFTVSAALENLEAVDPMGTRQPVEASATLDATGAWDGAAKKFDLASFLLKSSFATAESSGGFLLGGEAPSVKDSRVKIDVDLGALGAKLKAFLEDPPALAGRVEVTGTYAGERFDVTATAAGVKAETKTSSVGPVDATLVQKGDFSLKPGGGLRIGTCRLESSAVKAELKGEVRRVMEKTREGSVTLTATADPVELSKWVKGLGLGGPKIGLETTVAVQGEAVKVTGRTKLDGLTLKGKDAAGKEFVRTAKTGPVELSVEQGKDLSASLRTAAFEWTEPTYSAKGALDVQVTRREQRISGTTKIANLEVTDGQKNVIKEPGVTIEHVVEVDAGTVDLKTVKVDSGFVQGGVQGRILSKDGARTFEKVTVDLRYHPDRLGAVLKPWLPGKLEGAEWKSLKATVDGRASAGGLLAVFRGVNSETALDLAKFTKDGMTVSGRSEWKLQGGLLASGTPLDLNGGKASINLSVDFREEKLRPQSRLTLNARDVAANAEMKILERINPIFSTVNGRVDGRIGADFDLLWAGPVDPEAKDWIVPAGKNLSGSGLFGMKDLSITGSKTVGLIMAALGEPNALKGELVATNISVGQGRCAYTGMTLRLARYELRFSGHVTFEGKLQLQVEMPFTDAMVRRYAGLAKYMGQRFSVNLTGTVADPSLDYEATLAAYAKRALEGVIQDKAKDLLDDLLRKKKKP